MLIRPSERCTAPWAPRFYAAFALVVAVAIGAPSHAPAQEETGAGQSILIVNMEQILSESAAALSIQTQANAYRERVQEQLAATRDSLRAEEAELTRLRTTLQRSEFDARVARFEEKDRAFKRALSDRGTDLNRARRAAREELKRLLQPVLLDIMRERAADVMLDARTVVASSRSLDITDEAIERFNEAVPIIELSLAP